MSMRNSITLVGIPIRTDDGLSLIGLLVGHTDPCSARVTRQEAADDLAMVVMVPAMMVMDRPVMMDGPVMVMMMTYLWNNHPVMMVMSPVTVMMMLHLDHRALVR